MTTRAILPMLLGFVVPGAGHFLLGRRARGVAFFLIVVATFLIGIAADGDLYTLRESRGSGLAMLATVGSMGSGAVYFLGQATGPHGHVQTITFEYGRMFTLSAGLMNLLLVLDCWDLVVRRKP